MDMIDSKQSSLMIRMRRVIYSALNGYLDEQQLIDSLWGWQQMLDVDPSASIHRYCERLVKYLNLEDKKNDLLQRIYKARFLADQKLDPDPWDLMIRSEDNKQKIYASPIWQDSAVNDVKKNSETSSKTIRQAVVEENLSLPLKPFHNVANSILKQIYAYLEIRDSAAVSKLNTAFTSLIDDLDISFKARHQMKSGIKENKTLIFDGHNKQEEISQVIHHAYIWFCDYLGPVDADRVFEQVIRVVENTPESIAFSPRNFF